MMDGLVIDANSTQDATMQADRGTQRLLEERGEERRGEERKE
jgi:hypothetical protein